MSKLIKELMDAINAVSQNKTQPYDRQGEVKRLLPVGGVIARHVPGLQALDDLPHQKRVAFAHVCIHAVSLLR
mgnify:CR=1 FL=1